uniref:COR domain-containing protein n=1 Tax=Arcella intermedia TaxID=1963864 RepID=A0A6B2KY38_9EUKA
MVLGTALTINQTLSTIDLRNNNLTADGIRLFATQLRKNFFLRQCFFEETGKDGFEEEVLKLKEMLLTNQENNRCMKKVGYLLNFSDRDLQMFFETMESMITKCVWVRTIYLCNCNLASLLAKKNISVKDSFPNFMLLTNLTSLSLVGNGLTELPKSIQNLNSLKNLNFSNNLITAFPEWMYGLFSLESIIGEDNQIKEIPKELVSLPHLISVNFVGNPLTKPEIPAKFSKKKGKSLGSKFLAFLREYYELCQRTHRCKIYLLGEFEDIKLNFVESIQNYCSNRKVHEPKSTAYDDSCLKVFSAVKSKRNQVPLEFLFYVMDGSPQMHPAYEYLMSGVCIPMILFPLSGNYQKMYTISAWVSLVLAISKYPIYVIYISNLDYNMHSENLSHLIPVDSRINETYINVNSQDDIKNFLDKIESNLFGLDVYKNDGLSESHMKSVPSGSISAREEIEIEKVEFTDDNIKDKRGKSSDFEIKTIKLGKENTYSALKLGEQIPMSWINLNDKIEKIRKGVVTWEEWEKMAFSCGITYKDDLIKATIYLHHTTKIRYFATILPSPNYLLVLDIKWLAKILSSLLRPPKQFQIQPDGVYRMQDLEAIWGSANDKYPVPKIVDLLIQLNIIWKEADGLFIPLLSNPIQPPLLEQYWENNNTFTIWRNYVSNFVPEGCFSLMMIKLLKVGWKRLTSWKNGAILFTPKATLRIEESGYINCCLSIILRGKDGNSLKTPLSQVASCIGKRYPDMKVPCYNCMANSIFPPNDFKMDKVPQSEEFLCGRCHFKVKREFLFPELRHSKRGWYF